MHKNMIENQILVFGVKGKLTMEKYQLWAEKVQQELQRNTDWIERYDDYADDILRNKDKIYKYRKNFHVPKPLGCYITMGNSKDGKTVYDLRYLGQSVGDISINKDHDLVLNVSEDKMKYFELSKCDDFKEIGRIENESWSNGKKARVFRKFYREIVDKEKLPRQKEHMVEARLFQELSKQIGIDKQLRDIQPIEFAGCLTHMKTAVPASKSSKGIISVSNAGGEIDIFCRRKVSSKESRLTVIEVKDKVEKNESFEEAMFQAISYAVFIRELLYSSSGSKWMQIWGINGKNKDAFTINAVVAIPICDEEVPNFRGQRVILGKDIIELHTMALRKDKLFGEGEVYFETTL